MNNVNIVKKKSLGRYSYTVSLFEFNKTCFKANNGYFMVQVMLPPKSKSVTVFLCGFCTRKKMHIFENL